MIEVQHPILVIGLYPLRVDRVRQREAATECAVRPLDAQVVVLLDFLLELALAANGEHVVLYADIEFLGIDSGQVCLDQQFVLVFADVNRRRPCRKVGFAFIALERIRKQTIDLILQSGNSAKRCHGSHVRYASSC